MKFIDDIIVLLAKGKQALIEFFKPIWEKIVKWILKNKKALLNKLILVNDVTEFIRRFTLNTARHINYGEIRIKKLNPNFAKNDPAYVVEEYSYSTTNRGRGGKSPLKKFVYEVEVTGMRSLNNLNKYIKLMGELELLGKLPTSEKIYSGKVQYWIKELNQWKVKKMASTFFPKKWSEVKIRSVIQEASMNIQVKQGNRFVGMTKQGILIEFRVDAASGEITTAYIKLK
ncbi:EndoU domain-containing protein [Flavobacterium rakeshii]|uniref:EndoU domain-containing protein n=1 Tax=Flavobacterium rakeshii TaxID=1038845 RepID=UPI002E7AC339|nr:EndoU domain-containing protein [Flavobacterium rakeshii]MEE1897969.1 EndoU domain-containing protein [Flavobacterium rakeshii]